MEIASFLFSFLFTMSMFLLKDVTIKYDYNLNSFVGVCGLYLSEMSTTFSSILAIITLSVLILLIFITFEKSSFKTSFYNKD